MNFLFILNFNQYSEVARQKGKTIAAMSRYLWVYNFGTSNSEILLFNKDHSSAKDNLKRLKDLRDALPSYLRMDSAVNNEGKKLKVPNTVVMIQHPFNNNKVTTKPSARTKDAANNLGRGSTVPMLYFDEFAFMPYNETVLMAATPAFSTASKNAARNGAPYGILLTSTPGDLTSDPGSYAYDIINKATPFREEFYDYTYEQLCGVRDANTKSNFFYVSFSYKQLGEGPEYLSRMVKDLQSNWPIIRREVLLEWAETSNNCPFTQEDLDKIKNFNRDPIRTIHFGQFGQYAMDIYDNIDLSYPPIIGVDVAGATFNDSSAITIIDSRTTKVCATLNCNFIPADDLAQVIYEIVTKYMPNAIICPERNGGFGVAVIQRLCKTSVKKNLYWEIKDKIIEETYNGVRMEKKPKRVKVYGLDSTKDVRARLIEILQERVMYHKDKFIAPILHEEMRCMEVKKNGKVEHSDKTHDDQTFSYLMALYVWYDGKNLAENFNIRKNILKTDTDEELEENTIEDDENERTRIDLKSSPFESDAIAEDLAWMENEKFMTAGMMKQQQYLESIEKRNVMMLRDRSLHDTIENNEMGVYVEPAEKFMANSYVDIPDSMFDMDSPVELDFDDDLASVGSSGQQQQYAQPLSGNLSQFWNGL